MGFRKEMMPERFIVPIHFEYTMDSGDVIEGDVSHTFRLPTPAERENYSRRLVKMKGRKITPGVGDATRYLWRTCILKVEGYEDLPKEGDWKDYFDDAIGRIHMEKATDGFLAMIEMEDGDRLKKSEPSSVQ